MKFVNPEPEPQRLEFDNPSMPQSVCVCVSPHVDILYVYIIWLLRKNARIAEKKLLFSLGAR